MRSSSRKNTVVVCTVLDSRSTFPFVGNTTYKLSGTTLFNQVFAIDRAKAAKFGFVTIMAFGFQSYCF